MTGQIEIAGRVESRTDHAFMADLLVCSDLRTPARFDLTGAASLRSARVAGVISFQDVTIHSAASVSLDLFDLEAGVLRLGGSCAQTVNLAGARVNTFETLYVQAPPMHLRGLTYRDLQDANVTIASRLKWLRADPLGFEPQPYEQLAKYYHDLGREREARIVLLYKRRRNSRLASGRIFPGVSWWHRLASFGYRLPGWLFDALAGYGYVPSHALAWLATAWCAGFLAFRHESIAIPSNSANINAALYSLYALAPASPLGLEDKASLHGAALVTLIVLQITGYALFAAVVPAITRALSRGAKQ